VPGFCRHAIEAGCATAVRRRRLERGERHVDVESELEKATTLYTQLSLALYDEPGRTNDVLKKINAKWGAARGDAVKVVNKGAHEAVSVDLHDLVRDSALLARGLAELA
jgi:hypothetical protein